MQAYANVATAPVKKKTQSTGRAYWEFRAAESAKGEDRDPTWYTVRVFKDELPELQKGDFVKFTGKLKLDVFMSRDGKPMGVLTVMAFQLAKIAKNGQTEELLSEPARGRPADEVKQSPPTTAVQPARVAPTSSNEADFLWLVEA